MGALRTCHDLVDVLQTHGGLLVGARQCQLEHHRQESPPTVVHGGR